MKKAEKLAKAEAQKKAQEAAERAKAAADKAAADKAAAAAEAEALEAAAQEALEAQEAAEDAADAAEAAAEAAEAAARYVITQKLFWSLNPFNLYGHIMRGMQPHLERIKKERPQLADKLASFTPERAIAMMKPATLLGYPAY